MLKNKEFARAQASKEKENENNINENIDNENHSEMKLNDEPFNLTTENRPATDKLTIKIPMRRIEEEQKPPKSPISPAMAKHSPAEIGRKSSSPILRSRSVTPDPNPKRVKTPPSGACDWCFRVCTAQFSLPVTDKHRDEVKNFCSEACFDHYSLPAGDSPDVRPVVKVKPDHLLKSTDTKVKESECKKPRVHATTPTPPATTRKTPVRDRISCARDRLSGALSVTADGQIRDRSAALIDRHRKSSPDSNSREALPRLGNADPLPGNSGIQVAPLSAKVTEQLDLLGLQQLLAANQQLPAAVIQQLLAAANNKFPTARQPPKPANQPSSTTNRAATPQLLNEAAFQQLLAAQQASFSDSPRYPTDSQQMSSLLQQLIFQQSINQKQSINQHSLPPNILQLLPPGFCLPPGLEMSALFAPPPPLSQPRSIPQPSSTANNSNVASAPLRLMPQESACPPLSAPEISLPSSLSVTVSRSSPSPANTTPPPLNPPQQFSHPLPFLAFPNTFQNFLPQPTHQQQTGFPFPPNLNMASLPPQQQPQPLGMTSFPPFYTPSAGSITLPFPLILPVPFPVPIPVPIPFKSDNFMDFSSEKSSNEQEQSGSSKRKEPCEMSPTSQRKSLKVAEQMINVTCTDENGLSEKTADLPNNNDEKTEANGRTCSPHSQVADARISRSSPSVQVSAGAGSGSRTSSGSCNSPPGVVNCTVTTPNLSFKIPISIHKLQGELLRKDSSLLSSTKSTTSNQNPSLPTSLMTNLMTTLPLMTTVTTAKHNNGQLSPKNHPDTTEKKSMMEELAPSIEANINQTNKPPTLIKQVATPKSSPPTTLSHNLSTAEPKMLSSPPKLLKQQHQPNSLKLVKPAGSGKTEAPVGVSLPTSTPTATFSPQTACSLGTARSMLKFAAAGNSFPAANRLSTPPAPEDMERRKRRALIMDR